MRWNNLTKWAAAAGLALIPAILLSDGLRNFAPVWLPSLFCIRLSFDLLPHYFVFDDLLARIGLRRKIEPPAQPPIKGVLLAKLRAEWLKPTTNEKAMAITLFATPAIYHLGLFILGVEGGALTPLFNSCLGFGGTIVAGYRRRRRKQQAELNKRSIELTMTGSDFVLYLRSFNTANKLRVRNTMPRTLDRLLVGMHWDIEYAFSHALEKTAPLVAIGTKGRSLGAAKIETDDTRWEELFADLADKARAILIIPSLTPGTRREIMAIAASESLRPKTIWIMPPTYWGIGAVIRKVLGRSHRKTWEAVRGELSHTMDLPPYQRSGALIYAGFKGTDCKQYKADDLAEDRLRPLIETVIATSRLEHEDRTQTMSAFTLPERSIRYRLEEWTYRRWLSALGTTSDRVILVLVVSLFPFLLLDFFAIAFGLKPIEITSPIMSPTVWVGDVILTTKASPVRGDVILLNGKDAPPGRYGIARLVGLPGDRLKIEHGTVYLNGTAIVQQPVADFFKGELAELLKFPFECLPEDNTLPEGIHFQTLTCGKDRSLGPATLKAGQTMTEVTVAADKFWVMYDLRSNGFALQINQADVAGRASFVAYSRKDTHGTIFSRIRWDRIFKAI